MPCAFCSIVASQTPAHVVLDNDVAVGFLDTKPLFFGHVLVVPRAHVTTLPELAPEEVGPLFERVQEIAAVLPEVLEAEGTFVAMNNTVSQSVPHLHVHVVPRKKGDGLKGFFWPRRRYDDDAHARGVAERIRTALAARRTS